MMPVVQKTTSLLLKQTAEDTEEILLRLATIYLEQERYEDILALQSNEPENLLTKWMIARSYQEMDDLDTAYEHYQELAGDLKDNPEFLEHYIYLLRELGYFEEAKSQCASLLKNWFQMMCKCKNYLRDCKNIFLKTVSNHF